MVYSKTYYETNNYAGYLQRRFDELAKDVAKIAQPTEESRIVDFGCGYGGLVFSLMQLGFLNIVGTDISEWAISYGKENLGQAADHLQYYNRNLLVEPHSRLIVLDVLEHTPEYEAESILRLARKGLRGLAVFRIPVASAEGQPFLLQISNNDPTHINCHPKDWWHGLLSQCGFQFVSVVSEPRIYTSEGVLAEVWK
jgi:hypothetical protein